MLLIEKLVYPLFGVVFLFGVLERVVVVVVVVVAACVFDVGDDDGLAINLVASELLLFELL